MELQTIEERSFQASADQNLLVKMFAIQISIIISANQSPWNFLKDVVNFPPEPETCFSSQVAPGSIPHGESAGGECGC